MALAVGLLALIGSLLTGDAPYAVRLVPETLLAALLLSAASIGFGVAIAINRLRDFRLAADEERGYRIVNGEAVPIQREEFLKEARDIGQITWNLLWTQLAIWLLGVLVFLVAIVGFVASRSR